MILQARRVRKPPNLCVNPAVLSTERGSIARGILMHPKLSLAGLLSAQSGRRPCLHTTSTPTSPTGTDNRAATTMTAAPHVSSYRPQALRCWWRGVGCAYPPISVIYRTLHGDRGETRGGHWCGSVDRVARRSRSWWLPRHDDVLCDRASQSGLRSHRSSATLIPKGNGFEECCKTQVPLITRWRKSERFVTW